MPIPEGFTKKSKLKRWIKTLEPGETVDSGKAVALSGVNLSQGAVSAALAEFAINGLLVKVARGKFIRPSGSVCD
ncbi:MAG: hypothetical protein ACOCUL_01550 [Bacteroidota bacterium]